MSYFSKEIYDRKGEYAARIAIDSIDILSGKTGLDEEDLECVAELSSLRHKIHSTNRRALSAENDTEDIDYIGTQYSLEYKFLDQVNGLHLIDEEVKHIVIPEVCDENSPEDILDYFGEDIPEEEDDRWQAAHEALVFGWDEAIDTWSDSVRAWFKKLNDKYGTKFPC